MAYAYDNASNRVTFTDAQGKKTTYAYDTLNRTTSIQDANANIFGFTYDTLNRRTQLIGANGMSTTYTYDAVSNLTSVQHQKTTATVDGTTYIYDLEGNRKSKANLFNGAASTYAYDNLYQLTGVTQGMATAESYSYDSVGNRVSSLNVPSYSVNSSNELTAAGSATYTYDNNGNTVTKTDGNGMTHYNWDFENRLTSANLPNGSTVTFQYDPFGRRIEKGNSVYVYDGANLVEEADTLGNIVARYSFGNGIDEPLAAYRGASSAFYEADGQGSITSLSTASGVVSDSFTYDSFGNLSASTGTFGQPFRYTAREFDAETGLYYYRARYYDNNIGNFLSEDGIAWASGGVNFYGYARNNPVIFADPTGNMISVNGTKNDIIDYVKARMYLIRDSMMADIFYKLERSSKTYIIQILRGSDCDNHYEQGVIYWNPHCGLICTNFRGQSPAMGLGHELDHATNPNKNNWPDFTDYDNAEERRVIEGSESHAAHTLGEGIRHDHRGQSVPGLPTPTSLPPSNIVTVQAYYAGLRSREGGSKWRR